MAHLFSYRIYAKRVPLNSFCVSCTVCLLLSPLHFLCGFFFLLFLCFFLIQRQYRYRYCCHLRNIHIFCNCLIIQFSLQRVLFGRIIPYLTNETTDRERQIHSITPQPLATIQPAFWRTWRQHVTKIKMIAKQWQGMCDAMKYGRLKYEWTDENKTTTTEKNEQKCLKWKLIRIFCLLIEKTTHEMWRWESIRNVCHLFWCHHFQNDIFIHEQAFVCWQDPLSILIDHLFIFIYWKLLRVTCDNCDVILFHRTRIRTHTNWNIH